MKPAEFLNELSNKKLGDYKTAAGADATAADKAGDYKRGDKRMSGIIKATKKQFANDEKKEVAEGYGRNSYAYRKDGGANDERHDLDPSDWYFVKDGKMFAISVYPRQEQEAIARGYSRTRAEAKAKAGQQGMTEDLDENLHKWFKEKWVRFGPDGKIRGDCARGDDSEGKPKCLPQSKAHNLSKKGRASAAARKRREDPNPERSGKAINVNTKKTNEEQLDELSCWSGYHRVAGTKAGFPGSCAKNKTNESEHSETCPHCGGEMVSEELMNEKKDACYYKVKSRYKVWPSAYASGALVKCRKKGADSWGNGGKKNESSIMQGLNQLDEGWREKIGAAALAGSMALGAAGANARVTPDGQGGFTGGLKPTATVVAPDNTPSATLPTASSDSSDPFKGLARADSADRQAKTITVGGKEYGLVEISPTDIRPRSGKQIVVPQAVLGERGIGNYMGILVGDRVFVISKK